MTPNSLFILVWTHEEKGSKEFCWRGLNYEAKELCSKHCSALQPQTCTEYSKAPQVLAPLSTIWVVLCNDVVMVRGISTKDLDISLNA